MTHKSKSMNTALANLIEQHTETRLEQVKRSLHSASSALARAADTLLDSIMHGQRILLCPRRETLALAELAAALLLRGMLQPRPSLPAILLHPLPDERASYPQHLNSLAAPGDVLWIFAQHTGGESTQAEALHELSQLINNAHELGMKLIILTAPLPHVLSKLLNEQDVLIQLATPTPATLLESSVGAVHALCDALDHRLLGLI
jgi:phosphoheptose isomerase